MNIKSDNFKYIREQISNLLKWQVAWYFILVGFSMADHSYFELQDSEDSFHQQINKKEAALGQALMTDPIKFAEYEIMIVRAEYERVNAEVDFLES
ncbi:MAG: hypothetical protein JKX98_10595, partial [Alcanivoracaceae bacterium]|nr:hypothetical protein [Alcanivoracaceae bacterium]